MNNSVKFHSLVLSITSLAVFSAWVAFNSLTAFSPVLKVIGATIFSIGLYRLVAALFLSLFIKSSWLRRQFLGPSYMEGTWVGFYIGISGKPRFLIERFEQDLDGLIVRGVAYKEDFSYHTSWVSYPANIKVKEGELSYMYELKGMEDSGHGITFFNFIRKDPHSAPTHLRGFSSDLQNQGRRTKAFEEKLKGSKHVTEDDALAAAIDFYKRNQNKF